MNPQTSWFVARSSGIVAWALLLGAFVWGLFLVSRLLGDQPRPAWMLDLHRFLGGLSVVFTAIHVAALVADGYVHFGWAEVLVPGASPWKTWAVGSGVVAMWLLVAVEVTSLLMRRLPRRVWRAIHLTSFGCLWAATVHGVTAGTDAGHPAFRATVLVGVTAAVVVTGGRVVAPPRRRRTGKGRPASAPAAARTPTARPAATEATVPERRIG